MAIRVGDYIWDISGGETYAPRPKAAPTPKAPTALPRISYGGGRGADPAAMSALQKAMAYYEPGGGFGKGVEAGIERGRTKAVAGGMQSLVNAGLAGTTMAAGLGKKYEEEVAMPARARVEETRAGALSGLEAMKAQIIQGATESARSRALQEYLAQLQSSTSLQLGAQRQPSLVRAGAPTPAPTRREPEQPVYEFPSAPSLVSAGGGYEDPTIGQPMFAAGGGTGMYLGGDKFLRPEQVGW